MSKGTESDLRADAIPVAPPPKREPATGFTLYFLRHADAGDPATWTGDDADRPLSSKGRRQAKRLGRLLKKLDAGPDMVLTSPRLRASETARPVARSIGLRPSVDDRLSVDFGEKDLAAIVAGLDPDVRGLMLVGHDPDFSDLVSWLVGSQVEMQKGALARIDLPDRYLKKARGSLRWLLPPDAVPG
jgi:phosphohistidine phosphatase